MVKILLALIVLIVSLSAHAATDGKDNPTAVSLTAKYMTLRNTDPHVQKKGEWRRVADAMQEFASKNKRLREAPGLLLQSAIAYETLGMNGSDNELLERAIDTLEILIKGFPQHPLTDDAIVRQGELLEQVGDADDAEEAYEYVLKNYADGDMVPVARAKLQALRGESTSFRSHASERNHSGPVIELEKTIVIDPGHGGEDTGAKGAGGLLEKDVTFAVSRALQKLLTERTTAKVLLTRRGDFFMPLAERTAFANDNNADLFISLHVNASVKGNAQGLEVYYLDNTHDAASRKLADRENAERGEQADDLDLILSDLIQNAKLDDSIALGHIVQETLLDTVKKKGHAVRDLGLKKAPFFVLVGAHMPCVLVEMLYIDNPEDGKKLIEKDFRKTLAEGIYRGILKYFKAA